MFLLTEFTLTDTYYGKSDYIILSEKDINLEVLQAYVKQKDIDNQPIDGVIDKDTIVFRKDVWDAFYKLLYKNQSILEKEDGGGVVWCVTKKSATDPQNDKMFLYSTKEDAMLVMREILCFEWADTLLEDSEETEITKENILDVMRKHPLFIHDIIEDTFVEIMTDSDEAIQYRVTKYLVNNGETTEDNQ